MLVRHYLLLITQNAMCAVPKLVPAWQEPVYREKFGELIGDAPEESLIELDALPEVDEELARMQGIFGADGETKQSYVDLVYGRGPRALRDLGAAMQDAVDGPPPPARVTKKAKSPTTVPPPPEGDAPAGDAALAALAGKAESDPLATQ